VPPNQTNKSHNRINQYNNNKQNYWELPSKLEGRAYETFIDQLSDHVGSPTSIRGGIKDTVDNQVRYVKLRQVTLITFRDI